MPKAYASAPTGDIWVELSDKKNGHLSFKVSFSPGLGKYFMADTFFVKYDKDVEDVSESILYIPVIANLAPVAWAIGANLHVKELDRAFVESLGTIKNIMKDMFPGFSFTGDICVEKTVSNRFGHKGSAQLYSGGIDSVATYARHREEKPDLIAFGVFTPFSEILQRVIFKELSSFAHQEGVVFHRVESNLNFTFFNHKKLFSDYSDCLHGASWWASVQHGMGLLGICAPLSAISDIQRIYIASSATKSKAQGLWRPWGSHPLIDGNVAWADVKVCHDGVELSRQEKIRFAIKPYIDRTKNYPEFVVCNDTRRGDVLNCSRCEKCSRTIVGLALEGIDPNLCGFKVDDRTFDRIKQKLLLRQLKFIQGKSGIWEDIRSCIPDLMTSDIYGSKKFFEWFKGYKIPEDGEKKVRLLQRALQRCLELGIIH